MPAPASLRAAAFSSTRTRRPVRATASAADKPAIPAPAMMIGSSFTRAAFGAADQTSGDTVGQELACRRIADAGKRRIVDEQRRAIGADRLARVAHIDE